MAVLAVGWAIATDIEDQPPPLEPNTLYYAFSTLAQSAAALAAILGTFGLWRLDRLRELNLQDQEAQINNELLPLRVRRENAQENTEVEQILRERQLILQLWFIDVRRQRYRAEWQWLIPRLVTFLLVTLAILALAISGLAFVEPLRAWVWIMRAAVIMASVGLGIGPAVLLWNAVEHSRLPWKQPPPALWPDANVAPSGDVPHGR